MFIDTHAHLNFSAFEKDLDEIIKRCLDNNIRLINIGTNYETSKKAIEIAEKYKRGVYASIGLHPINLDTGLVKMKVDPNEFEKDSYPFEKEFDFEKYKELAYSASSGQAKSKVVAIGEIGLDYYWKPKTTKKKELFKQKQKELLEKQLKLAKELNLPVIFHCRMAHQDLMRTIQQSNILTIKGVMHGFVGTLAQLQEYLKMGFYIGFNGIIFKKIKGIDFNEIIKNTPLERILIETDCPYLTPEPMIGGNEPLYVKYIAERIAKLKNLPIEEVAKITTKNAKELFQIDRIS